MSLNVNNQKKVEVLKLDNSQVQSGSATQSVLNNPIDMRLEKAVENLGVDKSVLEVIKSDEFKNLTPEEQAKKLKEQYFTSSNEEALNEFLSLVKEVLQGSESADIQAGPVDETTLTDLEKLANKLYPGKDIDEIKQKLLQEEQNETITAEKQELLNQIRATENSQVQTSASEDGAQSVSTQQQSQSEEVTLDSVIADIMAKDPNELTKAEKQVKKVITSLYSGDGVSPEAILGFIKKHSREFDKILAKIPKDASPMEKLTAIGDGFLSKIVPDFDNLDDKAKESLRADLMNELGSVIMPDWNKMSDELKSVSIEIIATGVDAISKSGTSINEILSPNPEKRSQMLLQYIAQKGALDDFLKNPSIDVTSEEWKNMPANEKMNAIMGPAIQKIIPNFENLSDDEKKLVAQKLQDTVGTLLYGKAWESNKDALIFDMTTDLTVLKHSGKSLEEYMNIKNINDKVYLKALYYEAAGIEPSVDITFLAKYPQIKTEKEAIKCLEKLKKEGTITEEEERYLNILKTKKKIDPKRDGHIDMLPKFENIDEFKNEDGTINFDSILEFYLTNNLSGIKSVEDLIKPKTENNDPLKDIVGRFKNVENAKAFLAKLGVPEDQYRNYISKDMAVEQVATNLVDHNVEGTAIATADLANLGYQEQVVNTNTVVIPESFTAEESSQIYNIELERVEQSEKVIPSIVDGAHKYSQEDSGKIFTTIATNENLAEATVAQFSQEAVKRAPSPERQLETAKTLANVERPAVVEGLAAASNSVDKSVKKEYNSTIDTAASKFPPKTQAVIKTAKETGKISEATLSMTTVGATSNNNVSGSSTVQKPGNAQQTSEQAQTSQVQAQQTFVQGQTPQVQVQQTFVQGQTPQVQAQQTSVQGQTPQVQAQQTSVQGQTPQVQAQQTSAQGQTPQVQAQQTSAQGQTPQVQAQQENLQAPAQQSVIRQGAQSVSDDYSVSNRSSVGDDDIQTNDVADVDSTPIITASTKSTEIQQLSISEDLKEELLEKLSDIIEKLETEFKDYNEKQKERKIEEAVNEVISKLEVSGEVTSSEKQNLRAQFKKANSISEVYNLIVKLGAQDRFINNLITKGSDKAVVSFINAINDDNLLAKLYSRVKSSNARAIILNKLPESVIHALLDSKSIKDLSDIKNPRVIKSYILKNSSMSKSDFMRYIQCLDLEDRMVLTQWFNENHSQKINPAEVQNNNQTAQAADENANEETDAENNNSSNSASGFGSGSTPGSAGALLANNNSTSQNPADNQNEQNQDVSQASQDDENKTEQTQSAQKQKTDKKDNDNKQKLADNAQNKNPLEHSKNNNNDLLGTNVKVENLQKAGIMPGSDEWERLVRGNAKRKSAQPVEETYNFASANAPATMANWKQNDNPNLSYLKDFQKMVGDKPWLLGDNTWSA